MANGIEIITEPENLAERYAAADAAVAKSIAKVDAAVSAYFAQPWWKRLGGWKSVGAFMRAYFTPTYRGALHEINAEAVR